MAKIQIYGGRARTGSMLLEPFSENALKDCKSVAAFLNEFPSIGDGTDWGDGENNNTGIIGKALVALGGGELKRGPGIAGMILSNAPKLVQMMAGSGYKPPILTDSWTQLSAQIDEQSSYLEFKLSLLAYPVLRRGSVHVEGLRGDPDNLDQALNIGPKKTANMWDWLKLAKTAVMPEPFTTAQIKDNLASVMSNLNGESGESGKMIIEGGSKVVSGIWNGLTSDTTSLKEGAMKSVEGVGEILTGFSGVNQRVGYSFTVQIFDANGDLVIDSKAPDCPLDFYIENISFDFSPHLVQLINDQGKRRGCCPEWCRIEVTLSSSTRVSQDQIIKMCK